MPRIDKIGAFREAAGESPTYSNPEGSATEQQESSDSNKEPKSGIDFAPYLREPKYTLDDVVLPETTRHQVDLVLAEIKYQDLIYNEWGMGEKHKLDKALSINFSGPPGTGKTLTAEALAHALGLKILVVPYQQLESK